MNRGYKRFLRRAVLETSDFLRNDSLAVTCTVGVSATQGPKLYSIHVPESDLGLHFGKLLESGEATDITFEVNGDTFHAHKLVLAVRSPVLNAQLLAPSCEANTAIRVDDMEPKVFKVKYCIT